ncbi:secretin N-terminal domain-containing protein [Prosthecobacter sp.]|jgi:type II secretion system protein D|uniref:secretin N-terminal domain-containing protein n=1 Tax=Prosthecobacter sp. TaxID=1965333 RepID=UPI003783BA13
MKKNIRFLALLVASQLPSLPGHAQIEIPSRIRGSNSSNLAMPAALPAPVPATNSAPPAPSGKNIIGFTAAPVSEVLAEYFRVTGRRVLRDRGLEAAVVTIDVPGEFSDEEYRTIIEKGLLMHGYALVPSGDNLYKLIAAEQGGMPSSQNVPMILRIEDLPKSDQVVTHVLQLNHLRAEEASAAFQQIIPLHPYGKMLAVPNVRALVITEASQTILAYAELAKQVDQPPMETVQKTIRIERAEAEEVVEQLGVLMGLRSSTASSGSTAGGNVAVATGSAAAPMNVTLGVSGTDAAKPVMQAVARTNSIIVVARPLDMQKIEALVRELDAESSSSRYFSRKLNYLDLTVFLSIAEKALQRNNSKEKGGTFASEQGNQTPSSQQSSVLQRPGGGAGTGNGLNSALNAGGTGFSSGTTGATQGFGNVNTVSELQVTKKPISILIANTLVIADPASSKFFASGPPDQIKALQELAEELDVRPRQVLLSAIIGEFTLGDDFNFGLDWIQALKQAGDDGLVGGVLNTQGTAFANPSNLRDIAGFLGAGGPASLGGLTAYGQINKNLNVFLQTLERSRRFHVLQKPTVTTLNHQPASIYIGQQVAIAGQTFTNGAVAGGGLGFTSTTQYIPVRLQLDIIPHIYNDSEVMLEFRQQNNDVSGFTTISGNRVPNISEQGMQNSLIVPDRATAMLGGLITERDTNNKSGLPFLVRIPVIKHLFGSTTNNKERREMMIFVQPRILPDTSSHMLEQAKIGDHSAIFNEAASFAGMPEAIVPRAIPAREDKPNDLLPPPTGSSLNTSKKSFVGKVMSFFNRSNNSEDR